MLSWPSKITGEVRHPWINWNNPYKNKLHEKFLLDFCAKNLTITTNTLNAHIFLPSNCASMDVSFKNGTQALCPSKN